MNINNRISEEPGSSQWRISLVALATTLLAVILLYRDTAMAMVDIWERNETFTHGFLVPPISLWLIWRMRSNLTPLSPCPNVWVLLLLIGAGIAWLLGELAAVGVLTQFAFITMLVLCVPAILGMPVTRRILFPLAFLFFAVPFGEFALPQMMEWTANFTVLGLRLTGIPVYREGLHFVIPSGNWSVVEACSGVRYIIASVTVGTLFAYLTFRSFNRRLIFVGVAIIVPLIANWMRAYMIVMLGHLSGNKLAVGIDHLIYGWVFFGIVIMAMFWIGSRWREDEYPQVANQLSNSISAIKPKVPLLITVIATIATTMLWPLAEWQINRKLPEQISQVESPGSISGWTETIQLLTDWNPRFENPSASLLKSFEADGARIGLYIAYYRNQDYSRKMVSSSNVMVTSNDPQWAKVSGGSRQVNLGNKSVSVRTGELRSTDSSRIVVWQWYWINGHLTSSDHLAKAYTALARIMGQGDDSAVIFLYAPKEQGDALMASFAQVAGPAIENALQQTRGHR